MVKNDTGTMQQWRVLTPILLMVLSGIMTFTATMASAYLAQINTSIQSIGTELKSFTKETSGTLNRLETRVTVLEGKGRL